MIKLDSEFIGELRRSIVQHKWELPSSGMKLSEKSGEESVTEYASIEANHPFLGVWRQKHSSGDLVLRARQNKKGELVTDYLKQKYSHKPVIMKSIAGGDQVTLFFVLVLYSDDKYLSSHTIRYELKKIGQGWEGEMSESWQGTQRVTLERDR